MTNSDGQFATQKSKAHPIAILGLDHLEFYVGNPKLAAHFYKTTFGLNPLGYSGLETGIRDRMSCAVGNGSVRFVLSGAVSGESEIAQHINVHGDGVKDIAFRVSDAESAYHEALKRGAKPLLEPEVYSAGEVSLKRASITAFGDVVHSFIERHSETWVLPGFQMKMEPTPGTPSGFTCVDHVAIGTYPGMLDEQAEFYQNVLGFHQTHQEQVVTKYSSMRSKVMESPNGSIRFPLVEPGLGSRTSQVEEYLKYNGGPGVQHAALSTDDIIYAVSSLRKHGIDFLQTPGSYYDMLTDRVGDIEEDVRRLRELDILVDKDRWGYLMQIFSKPIQARPTFFLEIIQRKGAKGFGSGNIKALFEAVEREQAARGNL